MAASVSALILAVAIVGNGLLAGLFLVFACAVAPGFRRIDDRSYIRAFRAINAAILNGWFLSVFFAAPLAAIASAAVRAGREGAASSTWLVVGAICAVLAFVVTAAASVPLNRALDRAPVDTERQRHVTRERFEARWNGWNLLRTLASTAAVTALTLSSLG